MKKVCIQDNSKALLFKVILLCTLVLAGCSYMPDDKNSKSVRHVRKTLADQKLELIQEKESLLFLEFTVNPHDYDGEERHRRLLQLSFEYDGLISSNPEYTYGYILYGKFLRRINERKKANLMFMKANKLSPNIASVKQQIGNYLSEEGIYDLALPYFLAAIELSPKTALYHYQLGELLFTYRFEYVSDKALDENLLETQMHEAFSRAYQLDPGNRDFRYRYAESFFDMSNPDLSEALRAWEEIEQIVKSERERMVVALQKARIYIIMGHSEHARSLIKGVTLPALESTKKELLGLLSDA